MTPSPSTSQKPFFYIIDVFHRKACGNEIPDIKMNYLLLILEIQQEVFWLYKEFCKTECKMSVPYMIAKSVGLITSFICKTN